MNEQLKNIVEQVNATLGTNYNMMSFDSLTNTSLLQILGDVLVNFNVTEKIDVNGNMNTAIVDILDALLTIKYSPPSDVLPITFREGISTGKKAVIYPILSWIFANTEKIKKIKYLSTYVDKISVPDEFKSDNDMVKLYAQYERLIDEFWNAYTENKKSEKQAAEAAELKRDIKKMESDTAKLKELVESQKEKVAAIPNNAALVVLAKDYHDAITQKTNLEEQLTGQQKAIDSLELDIKHMRDQLHHKKSFHPTTDDPLEVIKEELHINKILAESKLPDELEACKKELEFYAMVAKEPEPSQEDLNKLTQEIEEISDEISALQRKIAVHASDDKLAPFRNQAKIVANKKNELSQTVMNLKQELEEIDLKIEEKRVTLQSILGGPAMYGEELKQYITNVRDRCNVYKELRTKEQALRSELGLLNRTLEILKASDPSVDKALEAKAAGKVAESGDDLPEDEMELREKCNDLTKEISKMRAEVMEKKEKISMIKKEIDVFMREYKTLKQEYEEATGPSARKLEAAHIEVSLLESQIKEQEDQYKSLQQQIEKNESMMQSLSEEGSGDNAVSKNRTTQLAIVKEKLAVQQSLKRKLKEQIKYMEEQKEERQAQVERSRIIIKFLQCKLET